MQDEIYRLESVSNKSQRLAVFEDDGVCAWLYLTNVSDRKIIADVWVHNRLVAPPTSTIKNYRGEPPPAALGFADDLTICDDPHVHDWAFVWHNIGRLFGIIMEKPLSSNATISPSQCLWRRVAGGGRET